MNVNIRERYSETSDQVVSKLAKADENGELETTILEIFGRYEHDMVTIWKSRDYFGKLSEEFWEKYPHAQPYRVIIEAMKGDIPNCTRLLEKMGHTPDVLDISECDSTDIVRLLLELVLPQYSDEEFLRRERFLVANLPMFYGGLALNACRPSVINGFRDFTDLCPAMEEKKETVQKAIEKIYGRDGKGIFEVAKAEWDYEQDNIFDALVLVAGTIPALENVRDVRCLFVAYALQMKILILNGQTDVTAQLFDKINTRIRETGYEELMASLEALSCLYNCYLGRNDEVEEWLKNKAPNENKEIFMMDMFSYLVKMRCYLQTGQYMLTLILGKKLLELLKPSFRPHDLCECHMLIAMACLRGGDEKHAMQEFTQALMIAKEHHYIRLLADEGQLMLDLIRLYIAKSSREEGGADKSSIKEIKQIRNIAFEVSGRFPRYLAAEKNRADELTKTERKVLLLMSRGLSNEEIGTALGKKEGTIKYHTANIYKKFNVINRLQAINYAKKTGLI